jgi:hypothetical protein
MSNTVASVPTEILIANLELEFELNHRKESLLKISNRKYFAIFSLAPSAGLCVGSNTLPGTTTRSSTFLITVPRLELRTNISRQGTYKSLIGSETASFQFVERLAFLVAQAIPAI